MPAQMHNLQVTTLASFLGLVWTDVHFEVHDRRKDSKLASDLYLPKGVCQSL
jgi:hypothetical protein